MCVALTIFINGLGHVDPNTGKMTTGRNEIVVILS